MGTLRHRCAHSRHRAAVLRRSLEQLAAARFRARLLLMHTPTRMASTLTQCKQNLTQLVSKSNKGAPHKELAGMPVHSYTLASTVRSPCRERLSPRWSKHAFFRILVEGSLVYSGGVLCQGLPIVASMKKTVMVRGASVKAPLSGTASIILGSCCSRSRRRGFAFGSTMCPR